MNDHLKPEEVEVIRVLREPISGLFGASWSAGGTWDHKTPGAALAIVADELDSHTLTGGWD